MVGEIYELKNQLLEQLAQDVQERGIERLDKDKVDMVKDLAKAEKDCWEAEYYRSVTEAMEGGSGYGMGNQMGYNGMSGAQGGSRGGGSRSGSQGNSGASSGYRDSMGRYARRGYGMGYQEHIDALRMEMQDPQKREQIAQELRGMGMA